MALQDRVIALRESRIRTIGHSIPERLQGVDKNRIREALRRLGVRESDDLIDGVFALLDNETESWFSRAPEKAKISDGATTAHLACHIGILQRGDRPLDREGRDYWIKPLRALGAIEPVQLHGEEFLVGHPTAKSPNSAYRLASEFKAILHASEDEWRSRLEEWQREDRVRSRNEFHARLAAESRERVDTGHGGLIHASIHNYAANFLPDYEVLYVDAGDGDRITGADRARLAVAGIELTLEDAMPDVLLWNRRTNRLWVIEAVTSDGEVDEHKVQQLTKLARRSNMAGIDFTTTYRTWKEAASRQATHHNLAVGTYVWILGDPSKTLRVESHL